MRPRGSLLVCYKSYTSCVNSEYFVATRSTTRVVVVLLLAIFQCFVQKEYSESRHK